MFNPHPDKTLQHLFRERPYQGAHPETAKFLFVGLDANFDLRIADDACFSEVCAYLEDGPSYWRDRGIHHPFLNPMYRGGGRRYHQRFTRVNFKPEHADLVSFVELVDVPTYGGSNLSMRDLAAPHIDRLLEWVLGGSAEHIFIPPGVAKKLCRHEHFRWLRNRLTHVEGELPVLASSSRKTIYGTYHLSARTGVERQMELIRKLVLNERVVS